MNSRKVPIALLSLLLAGGAVCAPAPAAARPAGAYAARHAVPLWLEWIWNGWLPAWSKSRGTMDPDGLPTAVPVAPATPVPTAPTAPIPLPAADGTTRSRGTMDPDGVLHLP
jgi:hypothetical protein